MGYFLSQENVAIYGAAIRLTNLIATPLLVVNSVVPPFIAEQHCKGDKKELEFILRATATVAGFASLVILVIFGFFGKNILALTFGEFYTHGTNILRVLGIGHLFNVLSGSCGLTLMLTGNQREMLCIALSWAFFSIIGGIWAVNSYGMIGVATTFALANVLQNITMLVCVKKRVGVWTSASFSLRYFLYKTLD
jgi:O-antigen/teichoic acid export membrane protein